MNAQNAKSMYAQSASRYLSFWKQKWKRKIHNKHV